MFAIEYFVGSARGLWARGKRRFDTAEEAMDEAREELLAEIRGFAGVFARRVVSC